MKTLVIGGPRTGKTTWAKTNANGRLVRHTDDLIQDHRWSEASELASRWLDLAGPWVIEGVAAVRALRKWLARNPEGLPYDELIGLWATHRGVTRTKGQETMAKGCWTVYQEISDDLARRTELRAADKYIAATMQSSNKARKSLGW